MTVCTMALCSLHVTRFVLCSSFCYVIVYTVYFYFSIQAGGLSRWPQKINIYPIPDTILHQPTDVRRHLADSRKLSVMADVSSPNTPLRLFISMMLEKNMVRYTTCTNICKSVDSRRHSY